MAQLVEVIRTWCENLSERSQSILGMCFLIVITLETWIVMNALGPK
jgi:hypothetical protein